MGMYKGYIYRHWVINDKGVEKNYIGQVYNRTPKQRWGINGKGYTKHNQDHKFARAIKKYGWDNFNHKVLFSIECETLEELVFWLDEWEKYYIEKHDSFYNGYNSTTGGNSGLKSEEIKRKISEATKGEKNPFYGKKHNEESRYKISKSLKGKPLASETKRKMSQSRKGKKFSQEHKKQISKAKGKSVICLETRQIFYACMEASEWCGISKSAMNNHLKGRNKSAGKHPETGEKLHWMYYSDYLEQQQNKDKSDSKIA